MKGRLQHSSAEAETHGGASHGDALSDAHRPHTGDLNNIGSTTETIHADLHGKSNL